MANIVGMPKLGFDMAEGMINRWVKAEGDAVKKGEVLAEIETDKATVEVESTFDGVVYKQLVTQGEAVPVGAPIAIIADPGEKVDEAALGLGGKAAPAAKPTPASAPAAVESAAPAAAPMVDDGRKVVASPVARKMARENQIDLRLLRGSGPNGRVIRKDVEAALSGLRAVTGQPAPKPAPAPSVPAAPAAPAPAAPAAFTLPSGQIPADERIPMDKLRLAISRRLVESKQQLPHFYVTHAYRMDALLQTRKEINELMADDQKLSVNDFIIKAVALALREFPNLNASLVDQTILRHGHVNVGVAVSVPGGLMTVVAHDADQKPLRVLSTEVKEMVARARSGKVRPDDVEGSTFSISNLGMYDVDDFIAIINPPEAAILAVGSSKATPVVENGVVVAGQVMKATLSADHRVTDGAEAAQFLQRLAAYLEHPLRLLV